MPTDTSIYGQIRQPEPFENRLLAAAQAQQQEIRLQADQLALGLHHLTATRQAVGSLAANPNATVDDAQRTLGDLVSMGILPSNQAQRFAEQIEGTRGNPQAFRNLLDTHMNSLQSAPDQFRARYGAPDTQDLGDNMLTRTVSPTMGVRPLAVSPKTGPGERMVENVR
ncbi:MAG TPA: hypothetical protein VGU70_09365 [Methylobacterium sp.]|jgi:hypothetical protein|nr:hypothetical protein [Methylobacterium sp.]